MKSNFNIENKDNNNINKNINNNEIKKDENKIKDKVYINNIQNFNKNEVKFRNREKM